MMERMITDREIAQAAQADAKRVDEMIKRSMEQALKATDKDGNLLYPGDGDFLVDGVQFTSTPRPRKLGE